MSAHDAEDAPFLDGLDAERAVSEATVRWRRYNEMYVGSRQAIVQKLRSGETPGDNEMVTPVVSERRQQRGRAAIYLRVSTEEQARVGGGAEGYSIPFQRDACHRKAAELGLAVVEEYVELGRTATTVNRPAFRKMFQEIEGLGITHVIVHKLDRLSRSPKADYFVDSGLEKARANLISVSEYIDDTPQGKLNLQIQRGMASYYSNNLATEVIKGLTEKVAGGGTPHRAPHGYVNRQRLEGTADIRWVEVDHERASHVRWAFEAYATGDWTLLGLVAELEARGYRTRPTAKMPARPLSRSSVYRMLSNPYYIGIVSYKGAYHEGSHEALVSMDTWLRVQDVLAAHNTAGEKDRKHPHYLKGSIWCGACGGRMIFTRNKGKSGRSYDYFFCLGTKGIQARCARPHVRVDKVEIAVTDFYQAMRLPAYKVEQIRRVVRDEIERQHVEASHLAAAADVALVRVRREREKLMEAHYAGAVPLDILKTEMARLTREMNEAEKQVAQAAHSLAELGQRLDNALGLVEHCGRLYTAATSKERRMLNQGFFARLFLDEDGGVEYAEMQEPFASIMAVDPDVKATKLAGKRAQAVVARVLEQAGVRDAESEGRSVDERGTSTRTVLSFDGPKKNRRTLSCAPSSNNDRLAEDRGFELP